MNEPRTFTVDDILAIWETRLAVAIYTPGEYDTVDAANYNRLTVAKIHDLTQAQLWAATVQDRRMQRLTLGEIAAKLHLVRDCKTIGDVLEVYGLSDHPSVVGSVSRAGSGNGRATRLSRIAWA